MKRADRGALQLLADDPSTRPMVEGWLANLERQADAAPTERGRKLINQIANPYRQALRQVQA